MENTEQKAKKARRYNEAQIREAVNKAKVENDKRKHKRHSGKNTHECKWTENCLTFVLSFLYY